MARISLGPVKLDIDDQKVVIDKIESFIGVRTPFQIVTLNSLMFNIALRDKGLADIISKSAIVIPDSSGISFAAWLLKRVKARRFSGIDAVHSLCAVSSAKGYSIFLLGARPEVARAAADNLSRLYPGLKIAGAHHGYFTHAEEEKVISLIRETKPDMLFVGLEMPKQEFWISKNLTKLNVPAVMGVGGSFDVISGALKRSPAWMRRTHIEWLFRFLQQPWRIKRIAELPVFVFNVFILKFRAN